MLLLQKKFFIKDNSYQDEDNFKHFIVNFYRLMINSGVIVNSKIPHEEYETTMATFREPFLLNNLITNISKTKIGPAMYEWSCIFQSEEIFNTYKEGLLEIFNTDFDVPFDNSFVCMEVTRQIF